MEKEQADRNGTPHRDEHSALERTGHRLAVHITEIGAEHGIADQALFQHGTAADEEIGRGDEENGRGETWNEDSDRAERDTADPQGGKEVPDWSCRRQFLSP